MHRTEGDNELAQRVTYKLTAAAGAGLLLGSILSILQQGRLAHYSIGTSASFVACIAAFTALQETTRAVRKEDSPVNSVIGGAGAAYLLVSLHQGSKQKGLAAGLWCGAAGGLAHAVADSGWIQRRTQKLLADLELADPVELPAVADVNSGPEPKDAGLPPWVERWLPIKRLSDEEWEEHERKKKSDFKARIDATLEGGLSAAVSKQREEAAGRSQGRSREQ